MENSNKFRNFWIGHRHLTIIILILIMLYAVSSINVLFLSLGVMANFPQAFLNPSILVIFAFVAFGLTICVSVYHLTTMFRTKKRKTDME